MKSLPTGWPAKIESSFTVAYMIQLTARDGTIFRWSTIDSADIGSIIEGEFVSSWTGTAFTGGRIAKGGLGKVVFSADLRKGGGLGSIGDFDFRLLNHDGYYAASLTDQYLDNGEIEIRRFILEVLPTQFSEGLLVFSGIVADYWFDEEFVYFRCKVNENEHTTIPRMVIEDKSISTADFGLTRMIPENTNGKPIPIQFGEIAKAEAIFCNADTTELETPAVATGGSDNYLDNSAKAWGVNVHAAKDLEITGGTGKGQIQVIESNTATRLTIEDTFLTNPSANGTVYRITDTQFDMILSDETMKEFTVDGSGDYYIWFWDDTAKIYVPCNKKIITTKNNSSPFTAWAGLRFIAGVIKKNEITFFYPYPFTALSNDDQWVDSDHVMDWDSTTYAAFVVSGGLYKNIYGRMGTDLYNVIGDWDGIYLYCIGSHDQAGVHSHLRASVLNSNGDSLGSGNVMAEAESLYFNNLNKYLFTPPSGFPDGANAKMIEISVSNVGATMIEAGDWASLNYNRWIEVDFHMESGNGNLRIYEAGLCFTKTVPLNERSRFFAQIKGRMFADTWSARRNTTDLVENPADVIEKIIRDDLDAEDDIDTTNFDTAKTARTTWELAYSINKEINSLKEIEAICKESMMLFWKDAIGKHTLRALDIATSSARALTTNDILVDKDSKRSSFSIRMSDLDAVYNEFYIHYNRDPATGEYHGLKYVKNPSSEPFSTDYTNFTSEGEAYWDYCNESYSRYGFTRTEHIYLDRVVVDATAESIAKKIIEWRFLRVPEATFQTQLQNCDLELCDVFDLGTTHLLGNYMIFHIEEDLNEDTILIKGRQMIDLTSHRTFERITEEDIERVTEDDKTRKTERP